MGLILLEVVLGDIQQLELDGGGARTVVGGSHAGAGGGYSGAAPQGGGEAGKNGQGYLGPHPDDSGGGSGYFSSPNNNIFSLVPDIQIVGGLGGLCYLTDDWYKDTSGNGGQSGTGGIIEYSKQENIFAYNGNMVTDKTEKSSKFYEYIASKNDDNLTTKTIVTENILDTLSRKDGKIIIPIKIFSQSGIIRETYTTNQGKYTLDKVTRKLDTGESLPKIAASALEVTAVRATNFEKSIILNYTNGYMANQGIGSGAGYLEASNGTFEKITTP